MARSRGGASSAAMEAYNIRQLELLNEQQKRKIEEEKEKTERREAARTAEQRDRERREQATEEQADRRAAEFEARAEARSRRFPRMESAAGNSVSYLIAFAKHAKRNLMGFARMLHGEYSEEDDRALDGALKTYTAVFSDPLLRTYDNAIMEEELQTPEVQARYNAFQYVSLTILDVVKDLEEELISWYLGPKDVDPKMYGDAIDQGIRLFVEATEPEPAAEMEEPEPPQTEAEPMEEPPQTEPEPEPAPTEPEYGQPFPGPAPGPEPIFSTPIPEGHEEPAQFFTAQPDPAPARFYQTQQEPQQFYEPEPEPAMFYQAQPEPEPVPEPAQFYEPEPGIQPKSVPINRREQRNADLRERQKRKLEERAARRVKAVLMSLSAIEELQHQDRAEQRSEAAQQAETMEPPNISPSEVPIPEMSAPPEIFPDQVPLPESPTPDQVPEIFPDQVPLPGSPLPEYKEAEVPSQAPVPDVPPEPEAEFDFERPEPQAVHMQEPEVPNRPDRLPKNSKVNAASYKILGAAGASAAYIAGREEQPEAMRTKASARRLIELHKARQEQAAKRAEAERIASLSRSKAADKPTRRELIQEERPQARQRSRSRLLNKQRAKTIFSGDAGSI